jgi:hypothetical protein
MEFFQGVEARSRSAHRSPWCRTTGWIPLEVNNVLFRWQQQSPAVVVDPTGHIRTAQELLTLVPVPTNIKRGDYLSAGLERRS